MTTILCPTRGGQSSFPNQDRAIAIARERGVELLFLYVSNIRFLNGLASPLLVDIETELDEMGEFMLAMAQERAGKAGVRAKTVVRRGVFRQALAEVIREYQVSAVVLGSAVKETGLTTPDYLKELIRSILTETDIEVILIHQGEIIERRQP